MQHFLNLEKCSCGAYRYLAIREHKRSYEIYLIHHLHSYGKDSRKYAKLASIQKYRINNFHDELAAEPQQNDSINLRLSLEQVSALKSILKQLGEEQLFSDRRAKSHSDYSPRDFLEMEDSPEEESSNADLLEESSPAINPTA